MRREKTPEPGKPAWLSSGFEQLLQASPPARYDVVVVGSGYGGAMAAAGLAGSLKADGTPIRLCILERGREYLSGMFPARLADLARHVRFSTPSVAQPRGNREGLFDVRVGPDVNAVLANGLGGGSLINAGVMEAPRPAVLEGWPGGIAAELDAAFFDSVKRRLGAFDTTIGRHPDGAPLKTAVLRALAPRRFSETTISIGLRPGNSGAGAPLAGCAQCGDCATGCNHGAKESLDLNLLAQAWAAKAEIFTGATVLRLKPDGDEGWLLHVVHTDAGLRKRQGGALKLAARHVILAAGTFGSTEILARSRSEGLRLSPLLGQRFSTNGDAIAVGYRQSAEANAVADENAAPAKRGVGPTITGMLDFRGPRGRGLVVQELAIPGALRRVFEETVTTLDALHGLAEPDLCAHRPGAPPQDPCAVDAAALRRSSIFALMGNDGAAGELELVGGKAADDGDGALRVRWPALREARLFSRQVRLLRCLARRSGAGGRVLPNPLWQLVPESMQFLFDSQHGPALTVHPLGGCTLGADAADGVVDDLGRVFRPDADGGGTEVWRGLVVLDGSIVRNALGINPALTIAALAARATPRLREAWGLRPGGALRPLPERRPFRDLPRPVQPRATEVRVVERMSGDVWLAGRAGREIACRAELSLHFRPSAIAQLFLPQGGQSVPIARELQVEHGELRVFRRRAWHAWRRCGAPEERLAGLAELRAPLTGTLTLFDRRESTPAGRRFASLVAWFFNRGFRDFWDVVAQRWRAGTLLSRATVQLFRERSRNAWALATHAGEVRELRYVLDVAAAVRRPRTGLDTRAFEQPGRILGVKTLTYERRANPWRQLMELRLDAFPALARRRPRLELDLKHLVEEGVPLIEIVEQNDQVGALADLASAAAYVLRLLLNTHVWSFRRPEPPRAREPRRLPEGIPRRLPEPEIREIDLDRLPDGTPVRVRLTRYRPRRLQRARPVVMIHGYSASGTTFAHHALRPGMAEYFYRRGRDVWLLDLRTSSGMPTARYPWRFEQAALEDLPAAFDAVCRESGAGSLDVFAHCMGSAMFSMAVLAPPRPGERFYDERRRFPSRVHRAVLSQIAPVVVMSPANVFRGYAMSYLRHFFPFGRYEFRASADPGVFEQLFDRLLATLPYPREEFHAENRFWPWRTLRFVGTRHRMDALYGRDFSLVDGRGRACLSDRVLEHIDDLFGPLSIDTVAQAIHFARNEVITSAAGRNDYVLPANVLERWTFPTLSIHGVDNGLADVATLERFRRRFRELGRPDIEVRPFPDFGHQDSLIGRRAPKVFEPVFRFLAEGIDAPAPR